MTLTMVVRSFPLHFVGYLSFCLKISLQTIWHNYQIAHSLLARFSQS